MANYDEHHWVIQIRRTLEEEDEEETEIPVSIFNVPKALISSNSELYIPQLVALGPYHHWREEIFEMERYKLDAAKRTQKRLRHHKFHSLVEEMLMLEPRIRGYYHKYLDCSGETLAWMMAIDASFLLEVLQTYLPFKEGKTQNKVSLRMSHLVDYSAKKSTFNIILKDIIMLENQIPLFLLRKVLESEHDSLEIADESLSLMLVGLCHELSPFDILDFPCTNISKVSHLLNFLYQNIVQKTEVQPDNFDEVTSQENPFNEDASFSRFHLVLKGLIQKLHRGSALVIERALSLPWLIISKIPMCLLISEILQNSFPRDDKDMKSDYSNNMNKPPLVEEITIPSVTELYNSGVRFLPYKGDIRNICFDTKTYTFTLPTVSLDVNTEVVLRNLVAYEASTVSGPLFFTRYTELMNGIVDTEEDVKLLREKGIVLNYMKSDGEIADLWNGMSKSVRLTRVPCLDQVIEDVNKYYSGRWKIKAMDFFKVYVFGSWRFLIFLAAIFFMLLMTLQVFCTVYRFSQIRA